VALVAITEILTPGSAAFRAELVSLAHSLEQTHDSMGTVKTAPNREPILVGNSRESCNWSTGHDQRPSRRRLSRPSTMTMDRAPSWRCSCCRTDLLSVGSSGRTPDHFLL